MGCCVCLAWPRLPPAGRGASSRWKRCCARLRPTAAAGSDVALGFVLREGVTSMRLHALRRPNILPGRWPVELAGPLLCLAVLAALAVSVRFGAVHVSSADWWRRCASRPQAAALMCLWQLRLPRALLAAFVGAALGLCGALTQGLFRNPLADPGLLGVKRCSLRDSLGAHGVLRRAHLIAGRMAPVAAPGLCVHWRAHGLHRTRPRRTLAHARVDRGAAADRPRAQRG